MLHQSLHSLQLTLFTTLIYYSNYGSAYFNFYVPNSFTGCFSVNAKRAKFIEIERTGIVSPTNTISTFNTFYV